MVDQSLPVGGVVNGHLKLHLKRAHLLEHAGPPLTPMTPYVRITVDDFVWTSAEKEQAGKDPDWGEFACMEFEVTKPLAEMKIEVLAKMAGVAPLLGRTHVPVHFFGRPGGRAEWLDLQHLGAEAGRIHFTSEFVPLEAQLDVAEHVAVAVVTDVADLGPGLFKIHVEHAELDRHVGPPMHIMSPHVKVHVGERHKETRKAREEGKEPNWRGELLEFDIFGNDHHH